MKIAKRIFLFATVNILIVMMISIVASLLGVRPVMGGKELELANLAAFALLWGFGAAGISLALSRVMAKWMMGVQVIDPVRASPEEAELITRVHRFARQAGLTVMPEVGIYESPELNAFATGPTRNRALVAVSSGLLHHMNDAQLDGVLAHEVAHVANGDMVTMTLVQGVVNAFVIFAARVLAWFAGQFVEEEKRPMVQFGVMLALELGLGFLGIFVVAFFSRAREYRADAGGASLAGSDRMIAALQALRQVQLHGHETQVEEGRAPALASLKISGKPGNWLSWLATHPDLSDRIARLEQLREVGGNEEIIGRYS